MTSRERILAALAHRPPDRVPVDFGGTGVTTLTSAAHMRLRAHLGLSGEAPPVVLARRFDTVMPDEAIMQRFGADARPLMLGGSESRPEKVISDRELRDEWGITWKRPGSGHFITADGPFYRMDEPTTADLEKIDWPDASEPSRYAGFRDRARALHERTSYAVILYIGPGPIHLCHSLRGFGAWLEDLLLRPAFAEGLLEIGTQFWIEQARRALELAGEFVDLVLYGDDIGLQKTALVRPDLYRRVMKPRQKRMIETVKRYGKPFLYHTCGSVFSLIPDLIDIGVDALNPVQVSANNMDTRVLKQTFGKDLAFWGAIDTQRVLPLGTPVAVRSEVRKRIGDLAGDGGYVLASVHNIQADVPPENVVAMFEAASEFGCGGVPPGG